jgi:hypothetical protein
VERSKRFLRFLELVHSVRELNKLPFMDPLEERMLSALARLWLANVNVTTIQAMNLPKEMSIATANRKLQSLAKKNLIRYENDANDRRIKYIKPTGLASEYFSTLSECMNKAAKDEN